MNRRAFLTLAATAYGAYAAGAFSQTRPKPWRIGYLSTGPHQAVTDPTTTAGAFLKSLQDLGLVENKDFVVEWRWAEGKRERLQELATQLRGSQVIFAVSSFSVEAARTAIADVPIVFVNAGNPVGSGFVASLARPGGRITGVSNVSTAVSSKYLELLYEAVPRLTSAAIFYDPTHPNHPTVLEQVEKSAAKLGVTS